MAVLEVKKSASKVSISKNVEISIPDGVEVKHTGVYDFTQQKMCKQQKSLKIMAWS